MLNDYNKIAKEYARSNTKPDKIFSILPTVLQMCLEYKGIPQTILDLGCGDGFFTFPLADNYPQARIIGIDSSHEQIAAALDHQDDFKSSNIEFINSDIFLNDIPKADMIVAPFVLGYAKDDVLSTFLKKVYDALTLGGLFTIVLDDPQGIDNRKFGATKTIGGDAIVIDIFNNGEQITTLHAIYHDKNKVITLLAKLGFKDIHMHTPILSQQGIDTYGAKWWEGYLDNPELCYISATK